MKQHNLFYEKYKAKLYDSIVSMIVSLNNHPRIFVLWIKKFISEGNNKFRFVCILLNVVILYLYFPLSMHYQNKTMLLFNILPIRYN